MSKAVFLSIGAVAVVILLILAFAFTPAGSGFGGGSSNPVYTCKLSISGTYTDYGFTHSISNFQASLGSCHQQSLLDLVPSYNLFGFTLTFTISCTDSSGSPHCIGSTVGASIPSAQTSYAFTGSTSISNLPSGTYEFTLENSYLSQPYTFTATVP